MHLLNGLGEMPALECINFLNGNIFSQYFLSFSPSLSNDLLKNNPNFICLVHTIKQPKTYLFLVKAVDTGSNTALLVFPS